MTAVKFDNISLRLGGRWLLIRLSHTLAEGSSTLLTGGNGAGKTTLLKVLSTAIKPNRGILTIFGTPQTSIFSREQVRPDIALLSHQNFLYEELTAQENLRLVAKLTGSDLSQINSLLERVNLSPHANRQIGHFSAGMKRRLCFARMLLRKPRLALLDEPFGQLDPAGVSLVEELIQELKAAGTTIVLCTHLVERGKRLCDHHIHLEQGRFSPVSPVINKSVAA